MRGVIRRRVKTVTDINVTNLVDVLLTLLIIFMLVAPILNDDGIQIELPTTQAAQPIQREERTILIRINQAGRYFMDGKMLTKEEVVDRVKVYKGQNPKNLVLVEGDAKAEYGKVVEVFDFLRLGGISDVGLVTQNLPSETKKATP